MNTNLGKARLVGTPTDYGILAFHPYRWNQLKVIPLALRRARTKSVLSNATSRLIYILKKLTAELLKNLSITITAEQD